MSDKKNDKETQGMWLLAPIGVVMLALTVGIVSRQPYPALYQFIRGAALLGYQAMFLAVVSSALMRHLVYIFGKPFIKVHHIFSITGLALLTLHPLGVAISTTSAGVFLPRFESLADFLRWGGAPALYLFAVASLAAVLRKACRRGWRVIHYLTYLALWLGTIHAIMLGTDFQSVVGKIIAIAMALAVLFIFIRSQLIKRGRMKA